MADSSLAQTREIALRYLEYAPRTRAQMLRRLQRAGCLEEEIEMVLGELELKGWLNDRAFAEQWVADRADRLKYGKSRLAVELRKQGIEPELLESALSAITPDQESQRALAMANVWIRKASTTSNDLGPAEQRRLFGFLQRRGFSAETITQVFAILSEK
ncbi:MAG TPA: regulatory protein RecX [Chthonomonadales bacterium]|nr:regulatory protein RecX [Chthonomonadales bacterium]